MARTLSLACVALLAHALVCVVQAQSTDLAGAMRVFPDPAPIDPRLQNVRTLHQGSGFKPYPNRQAWETRAQYLREQVLIAAGIYPLPEKCDLKPTIHSPIDRGDYTVEKVFFQSYPGFYVTGNLYRPKGKPGPFPAVLSPHGHWNRGRLYECPDKEVEAQLKAGTEKTREAAKYPLQARAANLVKMGCIVFFYDMVGYADADEQRFPHRKTWRDVESDLYGLSMFGLQTWNSIRAMDFVLSLPDVDPKRVACTGASGGGTQTFILMNADPRLAVAAPVCMISHDEHQGGCVCENASLLRMFTDNVELAATFAPKPLVHPTATGDWTKLFMEHGYPELKATYRLFDAEQNVHAERFDAGHNYNLNSRQLVYAFLNRHLGLGLAEPVLEQPFTPIPPNDLSVFDAQHPRPADAVDSVMLRTSLISASKAQIAGLAPTDQASLEKARRILLSALKHMVSSELPAQVSVEVKSNVQTDDGRITKLILSRANSPERIPAVMLSPRQNSGQMTVLVLHGGKADAVGKHDKLISQLLAKGQMVLLPDVFFTGELASGDNPAVNPKYEFFAGYNRTIFANRVHDVLTALAAAKAQSGVHRVNLVGLGKMGPVCLLARALALDAVGRAAVDANRFDFDQVIGFEDENYLPSSLRFGGLYALGSMNAPAELLVLNTAGASRPRWLLDAYGAAQALEKLRIEPAVDSTSLADWIAR